MSRRAFGLKALRGSPDLACDVDDELHLAPLLVFGEEVAFEGGREPALRAEGEVLQRNVTARALDALNDMRPGLEIGDLAADQSEHDTLVSGHETERLEGTCALGLVLQ